MHDNIAKKYSKSLVIPTGKTTDHMAFQFLNQARRPARAWFLKIDPVRTSVCVFVCVFVCVCPPPRLLITSGVMWCDIDSRRLVKQVL